MSRNLTAKRRREEFYCPRHVPFNFGRGHAPSNRYNITQKTRDREAGGGGEEEEEAEGRKKNARALSRPSSTVQITLASRCKPGTTIYGYKFCRSVSLPWNGTGRCSSMHRSAA